MTVRVLFFAFLRERLGRSAEDCTVVDGATVADLWSALCKEHPPLEALSGSVLVAVNQEYVTPNHPLASGDEVALIPPVSGG